MGKIEEAIKKINTEVQKNLRNRNLQRIGEYIIDQIKTEEAAEAVLREGKTATEALKTARRKAEKQQFEGCAVIDDDEVYEWVREYFGLTEAANTQTHAEAPKKGVCVKLEDFF